MTYEMLLEIIIEIIKVLYIVFGLISIDGIVTKDIRKIEFKLLLPFIAFCTSLLLIVIHHYFDAFFWMGLAMINYISNKKNY